MDHHIADYNFLYSILPEMAIWNKFTLLLDHKSIDNLFRAFPILKLFSDYTCTHEFIGTFIVTEELTLSFLDGKVEKVQKGKVPVYKVADSDKPIRYIATEKYLLICDTDLFMVDRDGTPRQIELVYQDPDETFSVINFSAIIEKYHNISEGFFIIMEEILSYVSRSSYYVKESLDKIECLIPLESPIIGLPYSEVKSLLKEITNNWNYE